MVVRRGFWGREESERLSHLQERQEGGSVKLQVCQPHLSLWEGDGAISPGSHFQTQRPGTWLAYQINVRKSLLLFTCEVGQTLEQDTWGVMESPSSEILKTQLKWANALFASVTIHIHTRVLEVSWRTAKGDKFALPYLPKPGVPGKMAHSGILFIFLNYKSHSLSVPQRLWGLSQWQNSSYRPIPSADLWLIKEQKKYPLNCPL